LGDSRSLAVDLLASQKCFRMSGIQVMEKYIKV
jgi:hypothetical protein